MVPETMKHAVRIGGISGGGKRNQRTYRRRLALERKLVEQIFVHIGMKSWIVLQQVFASALDVHDLRALQFQVDGQVQWDYRAHVYILSVRRKSLTGDHQVIRIERHIWNQKTAGIIRSRGPIKAAHWVADFYCGIWHNGSGWIKNRTAHRSRVAGGLAKCAQSRHQKRSKKNSRTGRHSVRSLHDVPPNFFIGLSRTASYACGGGRMYSEETKGEECQTIAGISGRTDDAKIGAGWATTFTATPAWASAQSEHDRSARPESFGCTCTTAT